MRRRSSPRASLNLLEPRPASTAPLASLSDTLAEHLWSRARSTLDPSRRPPRPLLLQLAGVPLVGKSTLARHLRSRIQATLLHIENDVVRVHVAKALGRSQPGYDEEENLATYATARGLAHRALAWGSHVIHDATNLTEEERRGGYHVADLAGRSCCVAFVTAPQKVLADRARLLSPSRQRAFEKLGHRRPDPGACLRPSIELDGTQDPEANVDGLLRAPAMAYLWPDRRPR